MILPKPKSVSTSKPGCVNCGLDIISPGITKEDIMNSPSYQMIIPVCSTYSYTNIKFDDNEIQVVDPKDRLESVEGWIKFDKYIFDENYEKRWNSDLGIWEMKLKETSKKGTKHTGPTIKPYIPKFPETSGWLDKNWGKFGRGLKMGDYRYIIVDYQTFLRLKAKITIDEIIHLWDKSTWENFSEDQKFEIIEMLRWWPAIRVYDLRNKYSTLNWNKLTYLEVINLIERYSLNLHSKFPMGSRWI